MAFVGILFAQEVAVRRVMPTTAASGQTTQTQQSTSQRRRVDFMADVVRP